MYAIFRTGGRQYEARPGQIVKVEKISGEVGENVTLDQVLLFSKAIRCGSAGLSSRALRQGDHSRAGTFAEDHDLQA